MKTLTELIGGISQALSILDQSLDHNCISSGGAGGWNSDVESEKL